MPRAEGPKMDLVWDTQRVAEALADPTRFAAYQHIRAADHALSVQQVTEAVGVHHTAVRVHLQKLRDAGLISETPAAPNGRGRPKLLYRATSGRSGSEGPFSGGAGRDPYRELSAMLARVVRERIDPREVGVAAGRVAATRRDPAGTADTVELIEQEAQALGFDPVRRSGPEGPELVLRHCPFAEVAAEDPETICSLHLGVAEGVADSHGDVEVLGMVVRDPEHAGCQLRLRRLESEETPVGPIRRTPQP